MDEPIQIAMDALKEVLKKHTTSVYRNGHSLFLEDAIYRLEMMKEEGLT